MSETAKTVIVLAVLATEIALLCIVLRRLRAPQDLQGASRRNTPGS
jgi:hypothetical protein